jgi:hypothetical protein
MIRFFSRRWRSSPLRCVPPRPTPVLGIGIVSADRKLVFLPAKDGGIEAVDLASGKVAWTNTDAARLAGASDAVALAWVGDAKKPNTFRVVAVDAASGQTVGTSDPIALPDGAVTEKTYGRSFRTALTVWEFHGEPGSWSRSRS